jgi:hypothetical protein
MKRSVTSGLLSRRAHCDGARISQVALAVLVAVGLTATTA